MHYPYSIRGLQNCFPRHSSCSLPSRESQLHRGLHGGSVVTVGTSVTNDQGQVRLQWHRETSLGSGQYVATPHYFLEPAANLCVVPGGVVYDGTAEVCPPVGVGA